MPRTRKNEPVLPVISWTVVFPLIVFVPALATTNEPTMVVLPKPVVPPFNVVMFAVVAVRVPAESVVPLRLEYVPVVIAAVARVVVPLTESVVAEHVDRIVEPTALIETVLIEVAEIVGALIEVIVVAPAVSAPVLSEPQFIFFTAEIPPRVEIAAVVSAADALSAADVKVSKFDD